MTDLFDQAIDRVRALPHETQDDLARALLRRAGGEADIYQLTTEETDDLVAADHEIQRGELATDVQVRSVFDRYTS